MVKTRPTHTHNEFGVPLVHSFFLARRIRFLHRRLEGKETLPVGGCWEEGELAALCFYRDNLRLTTPTITPPGKPGTELWVPGQKKGLTNGK